MGVYQGLELRAARYDKFRKTFDSFHAQAKKLPGAGNPPLLETLEVGDLTEPGYFDVSLAGTSVRLQLEYLPGSSRGDSGVVAAYLFDQVTEERAYDPYARLEFTTSGKTSWKHERSNDEVTLADDMGSWFVVASLLLQAIDRKQVSPNILTDRVEGVLIETTSKCPRTANAGR